MWKLIPQKLIPPMRIAHYCCAVLKEHDGAGRFITTGVRWEESSSRRKNRGIYEVGRNVILNNDNDDRRMLFETCRLNAKRVCNLIIDWTDTNIWAYIDAEKLPINPLYQYGFPVLGALAVQWPEQRAVKKRLHTIQHISGTISSRLTGCWMSVSENIFHVPGLLAKMYFIGGWKTEYCRASSILTISQGLQRMTKDKKA